MPALPRLVMTAICATAMVWQPSLVVDAYHTNQGAGSGKPQRPTACTVLTSAEIKQVVGKYVSPIFDKLKPTEETAGAGSECYHPGVTIQLDAHAVADFAARRQQYEKSPRTTFQPAPGIAEDAYFFEVDPGKDSHAVGIFAKAGQHVLTILMDVNSPATADSLRPIVTALTRMAVAKLK